MLDDFNKIKARLHNTERALFGVVSVLMDLQPPDTQDSIRRIMSELFEANTGLGFDDTKDFIKNE